MSSDVWAATSEDERRRLEWNEPAGRGKAIFCFLNQDVLDPDRQRHLRYRLTETDYHLTLCSFQSGIWEAARASHSCNKHEISCDSSSDMSSAAVWRKHLDIWRTDTETNCSLRQSYFSASSEQTGSALTPLSLILWHTSALSLSVPLQLLQKQGCCVECRSSSAAATRTNKVQLHSWAASSESRIAVWNAAQICRIVSQESTSSTSVNGLLLNPLAMPSLLKSAVVICTYAYYTRACPVCTGGPPIDLVDIFSAQDDDDRLMRWKETGEGLADWSPLSVPVCQCKLKILANCLRRALARDNNLEVDFTSFLFQLSKKA